MSNFRDWKLSKLEKRFYLKRERGLSALSSWLDAKEDISELEKTILDYLRNHLIDNVLTWNEQELSMHAIGPIFTWVNFTTDNSNLFELRELAGTVDGEELYGKPDGMVASGKGEPEIPYFCFHEYKKEADPNGDPNGQCLAAMLVAQTQNESDLPVYGVTIVGENWRFLALLGKKYDISSSYSAGSDDIYQIFKILKKLKNIVLQRIEAKKEQDE
jgi:hypothetical protein